MGRLKVGDLCITCNSLDRILNDGLLVVVVDVDPTRYDGCAPYKIRRVDGQPIPSSRSPDGNLTLFKQHTVWCAGSKLRRIDPDADQQWQKETGGVMA